MPLPGQTTWLTPVAVVAIVALAVGIATELMPGAEHRRNQPPHESSGPANQRHEPEALNANAPPQDRIVETAEHGDICANANSDENHDLCQQWRMAEAAERLVTVTIFEVAFLVLTFGAALAAAFYSRAAVKASERTAKKQLRAYVNVTNVTSEYLNNGVIYRTTVSIRNSGQTPAYGIQQARIIHGSVEYGW